MEGRRAAGVPRCGLPLRPHPRYRAYVGRQALCRYPECLPRLRCRRERSRRLRLRLYRRLPKAHRRGRRQAILPPRRHDRELPPGQDLQHRSAQGLRQVGAYLRAHHPPLQRGLGRRLPLGPRILGNLVRTREPAPLAGHARAVLRTLPHHGEPPQVVLPRHQGGRLRRLRLLRLRRSRKGQGQVLLQLHHLVRRVPRLRPGARDQGAARLLLVAHLHRRHTRSGTHHHPCEVRPRAPRRRRTHGDREFPRRVERLLRRLGGPRFRDNEGDARRHDYHRRHLPDAARPRRQGDVLRRPADAFLLRTFLLPERARHTHLSSPPVLQCALPPRHVHPCRGRGRQSLRPRGTYARWRRQGLPLREPARRARLIQACHRGRGGRHFHAAPPRRRPPRNRRHGHLQPRRYRAAAGQIHPSGDYRGGAHPRLLLQPRAAAAQACPRPRAGSRRDQLRQRYRPC